MKTFIVYFLYFWEGKRFYENLSVQLSYTFFFIYCLFLTFLGAYKNGWFWELYARFLWTFTLYSSSLLIFLGGYKNECADEFYVHFSLTDNVNKSHCITETCTLTHEAGLLAVAENQKHQPQAQSWHHCQMEQEKLAPFRRARYPQHRTWCQQFFLMCSTRLTARISALSLDRSLTRLNDSRMTSSTARLICRFNFIFSDCTMAWANS